MEKPGDDFLKPVPLEDNTVDKLAEANVFFKKKSGNVVKREDDLLNDKVRVIMLPTKVLLGAGCR